MRRCIALAERAAGQTRPNPLVGCVLHDSAGNLLGEGFHRRAGLPHAEPTALADAAARGNAVAGATAYVTLEPCDHFGRTPPCSVALLDAGVRKVFVGVVDPDPRVSGKGIRRLREAGVEVVVGVEAVACERLVEGFLRRVVRKRPFGVLKYAMTIDGKIATESGSSRWVTGAGARGRVHEIRRGIDAIVVGGQTVRMDDPRLTVRDGAALEEGMLSPLRVVMSKSMNLPREARLWADAGQFDTHLLVDEGGMDEDFAHFLRGKGVFVESFVGLTPDHAMEYLYEQGCLNVLWECGGALATHAIRHGAVQKVHAFVAPKIIGGRNAPSPVGSPPLAIDMSQALQLQQTSIETFDNGDLLMSGYLEQQ